MNKYFNQSKADDNTHMQRKIKCRAAMSQKILVAAKIHKIFKCLFQALHVVAELLSQLKSD